MATIPEALVIALQHHQGGRLQAAEEIYRQILMAEPHHIDALHLLGIIAYQFRRHDLAIEYIGQAIALDGKQAAFHNTLGEVYRTLQRLPEAIVCYRRALELNPHFSEAHNNLGIGLKEQGQLAEAIACYRRAAELKPEDADVHSNLGNVLTAAGRIEEAMAACQRSLELNPQLAEAHNNLGNALHGQGKINDAIASFRRALALKPDYAEAHNNLGNSLHELGSYDEAIASFRRARELNPNFTEAHNNTGITFLRQGLLAGAKAYFRRALELKPDYAEAHNNLGTALALQGKLVEAVASHVRAIELKPDFAEAYSNLGNALHDQGKADEAIVAQNRALELQPDYAEALNNLGNALKAQGRLMEATNCFRRSLQLRPRAEIHSNCLLSLVYDPTVPPAEVYAEHVRWAECFGQPTVSWPRHANLPDPNRRLRIGYLSGDFRSHAVACFMEPILRCHDHERVEVFCYANSVVQDGVAKRLQPATDHWRWTAGLGDEALEQVIRADQIDILVELSGHTAGNRLTALARKLAPLQVTYIGYPATTGLAAIDYRFTDEVLNPTHEPSHHVEQLYRLHVGSACFQPRLDCPEVAPLPAKTRGHLTFGAPHNLVKLHAGIFDLWARIMRALPSARLVLFRETLHGQAAQRIHEQFIARGIAPERFELLSHSTSTHGYYAYMEKYNEIDICLDTFPTNAGATGCESLWMGVPWLTLYGDRFFGRQTASVLTRLGLAEWIARRPDELVEKAVHWNEHLNELTELRLSLRRRFMESTVGNAHQYTRGLEDAYRDIWKRWCDQSSRHTPCAVTSS